MCECIEALTPKINGSRSIATRLNSIHWSLVALFVTVKRAIDVIFYRLDDVDVSV